MKFVTNFPLYNGCLEGYGDMAAIAQECAEEGLDGLEVIWDHRPYTEELPPAGLAVGYHLTFWSNWVDFWKQDRAALLAEFGTAEMVEEYYHGTDPEDMVAQYKTDLGRALALGAEYVVFHVSEVTLAECFTYRFRYSNKQVIDASIDLINRITDGLEAGPAFLVENQWWPGLTFTDPAMTRRLLDGIAYSDKGIMLDVGHLLHTNTKLRTQQQAVRYIRECYDAHGSTARAVRGLHLHQSLSGAYVEGAGYVLPDDFAGSYWDKYTRCYDHILKIDRHEPWTDPAIGPVVNRIAPEWVNNELSAWPREEHKHAVLTQMATLRSGGLSKIAV